MGSTSRIVCGYLRTPEGEAALDRAVEEAQLRGAHLTVLHSFAPPDPEADDDPELMPPPDTSPAEPTEPGFYEEELRWLDELLSSRGVEHAVLAVPRGRSAATDVLRVAREDSADLIVIGIRRRSRVGKLLLGSDAQTILLEASCPVLAVRADGYPT